MSLLGRFAVSRRLYVTSSSSSSSSSSSCYRPRSLSQSVPCSSSRYLSAAAPLAGGTSVVSEHCQLSNATNKTNHESSWSTWHVAAASFVAAAASASMIAFPRATQNEPSVDTATPPAPLQRHSVGIVQRGQNRSLHHVHHHQYATTQEHESTTASSSSFRKALQTRNQAVTDTRSYDVSVLTGIFLFFAVVTTPC